MKTCVHLLSYLAQVFLEWDTFQTNLWRKSQRTFYFKYSFSKIVPVWDNVENIVQ